MLPIYPCLWFDANGQEAAEFYVSLFPRSKIKDIAYYGSAGPGPEGTVMTVTFELLGKHFMALNGGPIFQFNPSISLFVQLKDAASAKALWDKLIDGGQSLMEFGSYPFSEAYGWLQDRYGLSWQIMGGAETETIMPAMLFVKDNNGKAKEAMKRYTSIFPDSRIDMVHEYGPSQGEKKGAVSHARFTLNGTDFIAMDSGADHKFNFNEAISLVVPCEDQQEIDRYWEQLIDGGGEESMCGWLKDPYGVSWQITPVQMDELMAKGTPEQSQRVMQAMMQMRKMDIAALQRAFDHE